MRRPLYSGCGSGKASGGGIVQEESYENVEQYNEENKYGDE